MEFEQKSNRWIKEWNFTESMSSETMLISLVSSCDGKKVDFRSKWVIVRSGVSVLVGIFSVLTVQMDKYTCPLKQKTNDVKGKITT